MIDLANNFLRTENNVIADFICPRPELRKLFNLDFIVWANTIESSRFSDTTKVFVKLIKIDIEVKTKDADNWAPIVSKKLMK